MHTSGSLRKICIFPVVRITCRGTQPGQNQLGVVFPNIEEVRTIRPGKAALAESCWGDWGQRKGLLTFVPGDDALQSRLPNSCLQCMDRLSEIRSGKESIGQGLLFITGSQMKQELVTFFLLHLPPACSGRNLMVCLERFRPLYGRNLASTHGVSRIPNPTPCRAALLRGAPTSKRYPQEESKRITRAGACDSISLRAAVYFWVPCRGFGVYPLGQPWWVPSSWCEGGVPVLLEKGSTTEWDIKLGTSLAVAHPVAPAGEEGVGLNRSTTASWSSSHRVPATICPLLRSCRR